MSDVYYITTPPSGLVISLAETKKHLRVDDYAAGAQASKTFGSGNSLLLLTAKFDGISSNGWQAVIINGGNDTPLSVSFASDIFTINLATSSGGVATSTVNDVIAALLNSPLIAQKITATQGAGNGTGLLAAATVASFSGGVDGLSYEDDYVTTLIMVAQGQTETLLRKRLLTQTMTKRLRSFPCSNDYLKLDWGNVQSVDEVRYYDQNEALQTLSAPYSIFKLDNKNVPALMALSPGQSWPYVNTYRHAPVEVDFIVGYGDDGDSVPFEIRHAMKLMIGHWYTNRESVQVNPGITALIIPQAAEWLLASHRDFRF